MINRHTEIKERETEVIDSVTCDLCKTEFTKASGYEGNIDWQNCGDHSTETTISYKESSHFPGDYWTDRLIAVHLCPACFLERLVPWLKDQGVEVVE